MRFNVLVNPICPYSHFQLSKTEILDDLLPWMMHISKHNINHYVQPLFATAITKSRICDDVELVHGAIKHIAPWLGDHSIWILCQLYDYNYSMETQLVWLCIFQEQFAVIIQTFKKVNSKFIVNSSFMWRISMTIFTNVGWTVFSIFTLNKMEMDLGVSHRPFKPNKTNKHAHLNKPPDKIKQKSKLTFFVSYMYVCSYPPSFTPWVGLM